MPLTLSIRFLTSFPQPAPTHRSYAFPQRDSRMDDGHHLLCPSSVNPTVLLGVTSAPSLSCLHTFGFWQIHAHSMVQALDAEEMEWFATGL